MPNSPSAEKRLRQNEKRAHLNKNRKNAVKRSRKEFENALENNEIENARSLLQATTKKLDKAAKHNVIADNKAARLKSRLARRLDEAEK